MNDEPGPEIARAVAAAWPAGRRRWALQGWRRCDSTMDRARAWHASEGVRPGAVVAWHQTAGRGRLGRRFVSPPGGLYLTAVLPAPTRLAQAHRLGLAAAVAVRRAVAALGGPELAFDWPNDLMSGKGKVGGILSELIAGPGQPEPPVTLVGIGINTGPDPRVSDAAAAGPAAPLVMDGPVDRARLAALVLTDLDALHQVGDRDGPWRDVLAQLEACLVAGGRHVTLRLHDGPVVSGRILGLSADGALRVLTAEGRPVEVRHGELVRSV